MSSDFLMLQLPSIYHGTYCVPHYLNREFSPIQKFNSGRVSHLQQQ